MQSSPHLNVSATLCALLALAASLAWTTPALAAKLMVDDFEGDEIKNTLGGRANVFQKAPSKALISRREDTVEGKQSLSGFPSWSNGQ